MMPIEREELRAKLDRGDDFKLVMVLGDWAFRAKRIPGSMNVSSTEDAERMLERDDEIVIYCSNPSCMASAAGYERLKELGYRNVRRYAGGLSDWEAAGYPLDGEMAS